jgi:hypothetical protein
VAAEPMRAGEEPSLHLRVSSPKNQRSGCGYALIYLMIGGILGVLCASAIAEREVAGSLDKSTVMFHFLIVAGAFTFAWPWMCWWAGRS